MKRLAMITVCCSLVACSTSESSPLPAATTAITESTESELTTTLPLEVVDESIDDSADNTPVETSSTTTTTEPERMHPYGPFTGDPTNEEASVAEVAVANFFELTGSDLMRANPPGPPKERTANSEPREGDRAVIEACEAPHSGRYQIRGQFESSYGRGFDNLDVQRFVNSEPSAGLPDYPTHKGLVVTDLTTDGQTEILVETLCFARELLPFIPPFATPENWDWSWSSLEPCCTTSLIPRTLDGSTVHIDELVLSDFATGETEPRTWVFAARSVGVVDETLEIDLYEQGFYDSGCLVMAERFVEFGEAEAVDPDYMCDSDLEFGPNSLSLVIPFESLIRDLGESEVPIRIDGVFTDPMYTFVRIPVLDFVALVKGDESVLPAGSFEISGLVGQIKLINDGLGQAHIVALSDYGW